jgi:hypothetical protein
MYTSTYPASTTKCRYIEISIIIILIASGKLPLTYVCIHLRTWDFF